MSLSRSTKRYMFWAILLSVFAITFGLLYYFKVIKTMDLYLAVTYVTYFVGVALLYNGAYNRAFIRTTATAINFALGSIFTLGAIGLLIYGLATGIVVLF